MKTRTSMRALAVGAGMLLAAGWAQAGVQVLGSGDARMCYLAAKTEDAGHDALRYCDRAIAEQALSRADLAATHVNRGILHFLRKDHGQAQTDYEQAIAIRPDLGDAYVNMGISFLHREMAPQALAALEKGVALGSARPELAYYARGMAHEINDQIEAAYHDYKAAAALAPDWALPGRQLARFTVLRQGAPQG